MEGLIKAKGFDDAVVTIGSSYYNVIVKDDGTLGDDQVAQILSVIKSETGASANNVKIIPHRFFICNNFKNFSILLE